MEATERARAVWPLAVLRPRQWLHFVLLPLAGAPGVVTASLRWNLMRAALVAAASLGYAYGLNAISDRATDVDPRKNPLAGEASYPRAALAIVSASGALAAGLAATAGTRAAVSTSVVLLAATLYSVGPRLKALPGIGTLLNVAMFAPLLFLAADAPGATGPAPVVVCTFAALLLQNQLLHELADAAEDRAAGALTTARALGSGLTRALAVGLAVPCALAAAATASHRVGLVAGALVSLAGGAIALLGASPPARRALHRRVAIAGGALVLAAQSGWLG